MSYTINKCEIEFVGITNYRIEQQLQSFFQRGSSFNDCTHPASGIITKSGRGGSLALAIRPLSEQRFAIYIKAVHPFNDLFSIYSCTYSLCRALSRVDNREILNRFLSRTFVYRDKDKSYSGTSGKIISEYAGTYKTFITILGFYSRICSNPASTATQSAGNWKTNP